MHYAYISNSMSSSSEEVVSFKVNLSGEARWKFKHFLKQWFFFLIWGITFRRFNLPKSEAGDLSLFKKKIGVAAIKLSWKDQVIIFHFFEIFFAYFRLNFSGRRRRDSDFGRGSGAGAKGDGGAGVQVRIIKKFYVFAKMYIECWN